MFENIGFGELLLILIVALVIFGPQKLPELGKGLGKAIREFKAATREIQNEITEAVDVRKEITDAVDVKKQIVDAVIPDVTEKHG